MFSLELIGSRPKGAQPYYSVVVRDPYIIGRLPNSDIVLDAQNVSRQHATVAVSLTSESSRLPDVPMNGGPVADEAGATVTEPALEEPLTLTITNYSKFGTLVDGRIISGCCTVPSGGIVSFGDNLNIRCTYRPIVVCVSTGYTPEYVSELQQILAQCGATVVNDPVPLTHELTGTKAAPIAAFHCCEMISDDVQCLAAMAYGYTIVHAACVFEVFAALAGAPHLPLHKLPPPIDFEPKKNVSVFSSLEYLRPESAACPFALYPVPCIPQNRIRKMLMWRRRFAFPNEQLAEALTPILSYCGAKISQLGETLEKTLTSARNYAVVPDVEFQALLAMDRMYPDSIADIFADGYQIISVHCIARALLTGSFSPTTLPEPLEQEVMSVVSAETGTTTEIAAVRAATRAARETDADRTPSELSHASDNEGEGGEDEVLEEYKAIHREFQTDRAFGAHFERLKNIMAKTILPHISRVDEISQSARRYLYMSAPSVSFLRRIFERCASFLAELEFLTTSPEGNNHALVLREYWDLCESLQQRIQDALNVVSKTTGSTKEAQRIGGAFGPHLVPAKESFQADGYAPEGAEHSDGKHAVAKEPSPSRDNIPECTRLARYNPPAPTKAYVPFAQKSKREEESQERAPAHGPVPPQDVLAVSKRHSQFIKFYGAQEGEIRFGMWMNGQSIDWVNAFYAAIDDRGLTMQELMDLH